MSAGLLLVTHGDVGRALLETATALYGSCPYAAQCLSVDSDADPDEMIARGRELCEQVQCDRSVLVLTDMFGATPCNVAASLLLPGVDIRVVTGVSLPMLIRLMNYADLNIDQLVDKAVSGGHEGVVICKAGGMGCA